jgi:hypothetical protein
MNAEVADRLSAIVDRLRSAGWKEREAIKAELLAAAQAEADVRGVLEFLDAAKKDLSLELRWEIDEVIEAVTPPPVVTEKPPEPKKEEAPFDPNKPITQDDLNLVYDDPRGLMLYKTKRGPERWFATQVDPYTHRPQTFELSPAEITQLKNQLAKSPYWVLGSGSAG